MDSDTTSKKRQIPDPIPNLILHVKYLNKPSKRVANTNGYDIEFNYIDKTSARSDYRLPTVEADKPVNEDKTAYINVKPHDYSRVKLNLIDGIEGSDFINANWIKNTPPSPPPPQPSEDSPPLQAIEEQLSLPLAYIGAQGPIPDKTTSDFWRMIWEHNINLVVMLTKDIENGVVKCAKYWPEEAASITFGTFDISCVKCITEESVTQRWLEIKKHGTSEQRVVLQIQYTGWPDYGVPQSTKSFLELIKLVDEKSAEINHQQSPTLVHCSAGIGRTGTFFAVHINLKILKEGCVNQQRPPPINLVNTILELRKQRPGCVITKEQFVFTYRAVLEEYTRYYKDFKAKQKANNAE